MKLRRWQKVLLICLGVLLVPVVAIAIWIAVASRDIPPPDFSDLACPFVAVATESNAYNWLMQAGKLVVWGEHAKEISDRLRDPSTNGVEATSTQVVSAAEVEEILATNAPALALLRRGLACDICQPPLTTNLITFESMNVAPQINLAKVLRLDQRWKSRNGDVDGALADCLELLCFGDLQTRHAPTLIQYLASRATLAMGLAASRELVASNRLNESSLLLLDAALRNVDSGTNGLPVAIRGEFQFGSGVLRDLHAGRIPADRMIDNSAAIYYLRKFGVPQFLIKPNETRLLFASGCREAIRNARHLYRDMHFSDANSELDRDARRRLLWRGNAVGAILVATLQPSMESVNKQLCRGKCDLYGVRLLIALRRYERAKGSLPDRLDDLVPGFIEAVPADPFDGQPLRYSRERRIIWAVGENLRDDGGSKMDSRTNAETENPRHMLDYVIAVPEIQIPLPQSEKSM